MQWRQISSIQGCRREGGYIYQTSCLYGGEVIEQIEEVFCFQRTKCPLLRHVAAWTKQRVSAQFSSSVNGEEEEKEDAKKQETQIALDQPIRCNCQSPHGSRESI